MPELRFQVTGARSVPFSASPALELTLAVENAPATEAIFSLLLQVQVRIEAPRRGYGEGERDKLRELFGQPADWGRTLRSFLWAQVGAQVPGFEGRAETVVTLPCGFDFSTMAAKYFFAVEDGVVPLLLLFSGTVFYSDADGLLTATQIPWTAETRFDLPVTVWKETIAHYYPSGAPLLIRRELFERLYRYQVESGTPTFDHTLERLLDAVEQR